MTYTLKLFFIWDYKKKLLNFFCYQTIPGLEQYAIKKFAEAFEVVPRTMAENAGIKATELVSNLYAAHASGEKNVGFDIEVYFIYVPNFIFSFKSLFYFVKACLKFNTLFRREKMLRQLMLYKRKF